MMSTSSELPGYWDSVIEVLATYIDQREDHWTLQTTGGAYDFAPYVQGLVEHDNMLLVEATSSKFLEPPLTIEKHEVMLFLGWRQLSEDFYPNYSQILDQSKVQSREIAELLAKTLHFAYGVDDSFALAIFPYRSDAELLVKGRENPVSVDDFLIQRIRKPYPAGLPIVPFSTPVVSFGNPNDSQVATLGINPSRREFETSVPGVLLTSGSKRLVDLQTLDVANTESMTVAQAQEVLEGCFNYFNEDTHLANWFDQLESVVLNPLDASYYGDKSYKALHLDLVQWATNPAWGAIGDLEVSRSLLHEDADFLREQLDAYKFRYILLNGKQVCEQVQDLGIYQLTQVGELPWDSGGRPMTAKIYTGEGQNGEIVIGWTLNIQSLRASAEERMRVLAELSKWVEICSDAGSIVSNIHNIPLDSEVTVGYEDLAEAYIKTNHYPADFHPEYWATFITLLRQALDIPTESLKGFWLDQLLDGSKLTTRVLPTENSLELSTEAPPGAAHFATWKEYSMEIERMRNDLVTINRFYSRFLIREVLGEDAAKRIPMSQLIAAGLPAVVPSWDVMDWADAY